MPKQQRKNLFIFLLLAFLTILLGFATNVLSEDFDKWCIEHFGAGYKPWLLGLLIAGTLVALYITTDLGKSLFSKNAIERPLVLSPEETQRNYATIRQYLLEKRYRPRLQQKLAGDQLFNLRVKPTTIGVSPEKAATLITLQGRKTGEEIHQIFEQSRRRLLVTGAPGSGKTSLLLHLAIELLETDLDNLTAVLNLATWRSDFETLDDWLQEILPAELGVTKRYAADILQQGKLTLLLDGLDEVDEAHRTSCLDAIKGYSGKKQKDFVISTRKDEYKALEKDAPVWAQIEVLPLTKTQLLTQLDQADRRDFPEAPDLKAALENDPLLLKVAETPFYLNCLQLLFRGGSTLSEMNFKGETVEARQTEIVERFTQQALVMRSPHGYTPEQVRHWLSFFASRLTQRNMVVFELIFLQYYWWKWSKMQILFSWLSFGLASGLALGLVNGLIGGLAFGLPFGLLAWFLTWICSGLTSRILWITTRDLVNLSSKKLIKNIARNWYIGIAFGLVFGQINGVIYGLVSGVSVASIFGLQDVIRADYNNILQITTPYQRFTASAKALHFSILQHWLLRWQLYRAGVLPLRLVDFLNEMTARPPPRNRRRHLALPSPHSTGVFCGPMAIRLTFFRNSPLKNRCNHAKT